MLKAILFDVIGTTVKETGSDIVVSCLVDAFKSNGIPVDRRAIQQNRGKEKQTMIREILQNHHAAPSLTEPVYDWFRKNLKENLHLFVENEGAGEIFMHARKSRLKVGVGTGLDRDVFDAIYDRLGWARYDLDYIGIANEVGHSRPHPAMIHDMMKKLEIPDPSQLLKVGDTVADIQEGKNAGVLTAVILSGSQQEEDLLACNPDYVIRSLSTLRMLIDASPQ